ncbi:FlgO family outer membrane protein [Psychromonas sp. MME2]|uniref:FlgO family outer membrane protein n=1 Tax=Psychromonas sp. MME2 TaxID=3231033 RepID=UPI00339CF12A
MNNLLVLAGAALLLQGCASTAPEQTSAARNIETTAVVNTRSVSKDDHLYYYIARSSANSDAALGEVNASIVNNNSNSDITSFVGERSFVLSEVVSDMAEQLIINLPSTSRHQAIALTSIVDLHNHQTTNWLGQTISEQFIHELHIRHIPIVDFKITGNIQLTPEGEFALTRDWKRLNKDIDVNRILTGTMSRNEEGVMLNIRIVNANNNLVESTSSAFLPNNMFVGGNYDYQEKNISHVIVH